MIGHLLGGSPRKGTSPRMISTRSSPPSDTTRGSGPVFGLGMRTRSRALETDALLEPSPRRVPSPRAPRARGSSTTPRMEVDTPKAVQPPTGSSPPTPSPPSSRESSSSPPPMRSASPISRRSSVSSDDDEYDVWSENPSEFKTRYYFNQKNKTKLVISDHP